METVHRAPMPKFATFSAFISSLRRNAMSEAACKILSMPPAASTGYIWSKDTPSEKASLSSQGRRGDGGRRVALSSPQRPGDLRPGLPKLRNVSFQIIARRSWMRGLTGIAAPSHESTYLYICRPGSQVLHFVLAAAVDAKTKRPKRGRQQKEVEFV